MDHERWHVMWKLNRKVWFIHSKHSTRLEARESARQRKAEYPAFTVRIRDTFTRAHKNAQKQRQDSRADNSVHGRR